MMAIGNKRGCGGSPRVGDALVLGGTTVTSAESECWQLLENTQQQASDLCFLYEAKFRGHGRRATHMQIATHMKLERLSFESAQTQMVGQLCREPQITLAIAGIASAFTQILMTPQFDFDSEG
jgi:hypothetical protein